METRVARPSWDAAHNNSDESVSWHDVDWDAFFSFVNKDGAEARQGLGPCWEWLGGKMSQGYGMFYIKSLKKQRLTHRLGFLSAARALSDNICVLHKCDNRVCVNPAHLFLGSRTDNAKDRLEKGRAPRNSPIPIEIVKNIQQMRAAGATYSKISSDTGVPFWTVREICTRRRGHHVKTYHR